MDRTGKKGQMICGGSDRIFLGSTFQNQVDGAPNPGIPTQKRSLSKRKKQSADMHQDVQPGLPSQRGVMGGPQRSTHPSMHQTVLRAPREQQLEEVKEELRGEQQLTDRQGGYAESEQQYGPAMVQGAQGNQGTQGGQGETGNSIDVLERNGFRRIFEDQADQAHNIKGSLDHQAQLDQVDPGNEMLDRANENARRQQKISSIDHQMQPFSNRSKVLAQQHRRTHRDWKRAAFLYQRGDKMQRVTPGAAGPAPEGGSRPEMSANHPAFHRHFEALSVAPLTTGSRGNNRERSQQIHKTPQTSMIVGAIHSFAKSNARTDKQLAHTQARLRTAGFDTEAQLAVSREAYGQHPRAPTGGRGKRGAGAGARPPIDHDGRHNDGQRGGEPVAWQVSNEVVKHEASTSDQMDPHHMTNDPTESIGSRPSQKMAPNNSKQSSQARGNQMKFRIHHANHVQPEESHSNQNDHDVEQDDGRECRDIGDSGDAKPLAISAADRFASRSSRKNRQLASKTVSKLSKSHQRKDDQLVINDAYQESLNLQKLTQVSRSMGVTRRHQGAGSLHNAFASSGLNTASGPAQSPGTSNAAIFSKKKFVQVKKYAQFKDFTRPSEMASGHIQSLNTGDGVESIHPVSLSSQDRPLAPVLPRPTDKIGGSRQAARFESGTNYAQDFQQARYLLSMLETGDSAAPSQSQSSQQASKQARKHNQMQRKTAIEQIYKNPFKVNQYQQAHILGATQGTGANANVTAGRVPPHALSGSRNVNMLNTANHPPRQISPELEAGFINQPHRPSIESKNHNVRPEVQSILPKKKQDDGDKALLKPVKNGLALKPLNVPTIARISKIKVDPPRSTKITKEKAFALQAESPRYDGMRADEEIEDVSDYEQQESGTKNNMYNQVSRLPTSNGKSVKRNEHGSQASRQRNNRSPLQGMGASSVSQAVGSKNHHPNRNKFENAAARYQAEVNDVIKHRGAPLAPSIHQAQVRTKDLADQRLLAESKAAPGQQKFTTTGQKDINFVGNPQSQSKQKASPYTQVLNAGPTSGASGGPSAVSEAPITFSTSNNAGGQAPHKRQLAQRQQRAVISPQAPGVPNQESVAAQMASPYQSPPHLTQPAQPSTLQLNHLKVQRAYKNAVGIGSKKQYKQNTSVGGKQQKREHLVKNAIDKINLKIDDLHQNLANYEQNIDLTLKEIPRDIRSVNNSNFNNSSSRQQNQETDRFQYDKFTNITNRTSHAGNGQGAAKATDIHDAERQERLLQDNLSEKTLKTILDFHSDRAQTQQQRRMQKKYKHESTQNCGRPPDSHLSQQSQLVSQECYRLVTSRHSKQRAHGAASGIAGIIGPLGEMNLMGSTEDYRYQNRDFGESGAFEPATATALSIKEHDLQLKNMNTTPLNMTHDQIQRHDQGGGPVGAEDTLMGSENHIAGHQGLKDLNLTNLSILSSKVDKDIAINDSAELQNDQDDARAQRNQAPKQHADLNEKTSFTNLQAYFQQRGINNDTNLSAALSFHNISTARAPGTVAREATEGHPAPNPNLNNLVRGGTNSAAGGASNYGSGPDGAPSGTVTHGHHAGGDYTKARDSGPSASGNALTKADVGGGGTDSIGSPITTSRPAQRLQSQNFYPPQAQSRLSQKSAIVELAAVQQMGPLHPPSSPGPSQSIK